MTQKQLELEEEMEGDPPFDEFVQQILDTFQEETDANATIPADVVTTPEPCTFPEQTLAGIVNCVRHAARSDIRLTRVANGQAAVVHMLRVSRWIPQYQRIAQERDELLERQEKWLAERAKFIKEKETDRKEIEELKKIVKCELPEKVLTTNQTDLTSTAEQQPKEIPPQASGSGIGKHPVAARRPSSTTSASGSEIPKRATAPRRLSSATSASDISPVNRATRPGNVTLVLTKYQPGGRCVPANAN
ncbi:hypothetical protein GE061_000662 [Apolygus lucorum]|uniref:Uncharacterized protein n=1 Tax=Apolygus lucorum TaxID=248454 RepID=A0A6A4JWT6_APOLU|nr:hypothetical protein GE061_000662 [Apolygus lucorum]